MPIGEDERHARDAHRARGLLVVAHSAGIVVGGEDGGHAALVQAGLCGQPLEHLVVVDGQPLAEVRGVEALVRGPWRAGPPISRARAHRRWASKVLARTAVSRSKTRPSAGASSLTRAFISRPPSRLRRTSAEVLGDAHPLADGTRGRAGRPAAAA